jgi:hypothetical protein
MRRRSGDRPAPSTGRSSRLTAASGQVSARELRGTSRSAATGRRVPVRSPDMPPVAVIAFVVHAYILCGTTSVTAESTALDRRTAVTMIGGGTLCGGACADHMVLDRTNATVWGVGANVGTRIRVSLEISSRVSVGEISTWEVVVRSDGSWAVSLGIQNASTGSMLKFSGSDNSTASLVDVAFGDVYLCSGQSNMWYPLNDIVNGTAVVIEGETLHDIRVMNVNHLSAPQGPQSTLKWGRSWDGTGTCPHPNSCSPSGWSSMNEAIAASFSAVCFLTGRDVYRGLGGKVPIGLVEAAWGGTRIESWTSPDGLAKCSGKGTAKCGLCCTDSTSNSGGWCKTQQPKGSRACARMNSTNSGNLCSAAYNGMMAPLLPMRLKAMLWCDTNTFLIV